MPAFLSLLRLAAKAGPYVVQLLTAAWPMVKENEEVKANVQRFVSRLAAADRGQHRVRAQIDVLRAEAERLAARASSVEGKDRADQWLSRLDDLESAVRLVEATGGLERARVSRQVRRELALLKRQMLAATIGVGEQDLPAPPDGEGEGGDPGDPASRGPGEGPRA